MSERTCENCRWWNRHSGPEYANDVGECRRHAPAVSARHADARWTTTWETDWCGEWADKATTPEQEEWRELVRQFAVAIVSAGLGEKFDNEDAWFMAEKLACEEPRGDK